MYKRNDSDGQSWKARLIKPCSVFAFQSSLFRKFVNKTLAFIENSINSCQWFLLTFAWKSGKSNDEKGEPRLGNKDVKNGQNQAKLDEIVHLTSQAGPSCSSGFSKSTE